MRRLWTDTYVFSFDLRVSSVGGSQNSQFMRQYFFSASRLICLFVKNQMANTSGIWIGSSAGGTLIIYMTQSMFNSDIWIPPNVSVDPKSHWWKHRVNQFNWNAHIEYYMTNKFIALRHGNEGPAVSKRVRKAKEQMNALWVCASPTSCIRYNLYIIAQIAINRVSWDGVQVEVLTQHTTHA